MHNTHRLQKKSFVQIMRTALDNMNWSLSIHNGLEQKTADMVREFGIEDRVIYSSFNHYSLEKLKKYAPDASIGLLMEGDFIRIPEDANLLSASAVHPPESILAKAYVEHCHAHGIKVHTWTVDNPARMREIIAMGVDAFITDCPDNGRRIADEI